MQVKNLQPNNGQGQTEMINPTILALGTEYINKFLKNSDNKWQTTKNFVFTICEV